MSVRLKVDLKPLRRCVIRSLDRRGCRWLLSWLATAYARIKTGTRARVFYDQGWIRTMGTGTFLVDSTVFEYYTEQLDHFGEYFHKMWDEVDHLWFPIYKPKPGHVIMDIGSGVGQAVLVFSQRVGKTGKVFAIEAHPHTFRMLKKTCELNGLSNTFCIQRAVLDGPGTVTIEDKEATAENRIFVDEGDSQNIKVRGDSVDNLCEELGIEQIDFLAMNIEGAERLAIRGMEHTLDKVRHIVIACHDFVAERTGDDWFRTKGVVTDLLEGHSFKIVTRDNHPDVAVRDWIHAFRTR